MPVFFLNFGQYFFRRSQRPYHVLTSIRALTLIVLAPKSVLEFIGHCLVGALPIDSASSIFLCVLQFQWEPEAGKNRFIVRLAISRWTGFHVQDVISVFCEKYALYLKHCVAVWASPIEQFLRFFHEAGAHGAEFPFQTPVVKSSSSLILFPKSNFRAVGLGLLPTLAFEFPRRSNTWLCLHLMVILQAVHNLCLCCFLRLTKLKYSAE